MFNWHFSSSSFLFCFAARESREGARVGISAPKGKTKHSHGFNLSHISCTVFFILIYFKFPLNNYILILDLVYIYFCFCNLPKENVVRETEIQTLQRKVRKYKNSFQMYSKCRAQYSCMFMCFYLLSQEKPAREADMQTIQRKVTKEKKVWRWRILLTMFHTSLLQYLNHFLDILCYFCYTFVVFIFIVWVLLLTTHNWKLYLHPMEHKGSKLFFFFFGSINLLCLWYYFVFASWYFSSRHLLFLISLLHRSPHHASWDERKIAA